MAGRLKVREEAPDVVLSEILLELGIENTPLPQTDKVPDIYLLLAGIRVIIELKEVGHRAALEEQMRGRLAENRCDVVIGLEFPKSVTGSTLQAPNAREIRKALLKTTFVALAMAKGAKDPRVEPRVLFGDARVRAGHLPELLSRAASEALPARELENAIAKVRSAIGGFAQSAMTLPSAEKIAEKVREVLDFEP